MEINKEDVVTTYYTIEMTEEEATDLMRFLGAIGDSPEGASGKLFRTLKKTL